MSSPILCGVYDQSGDLVFEYSSSDHALEALTKTLSKVSSSYDIDTIIYANGPGSYMGLKVSYVVLKSYSIVKNCKLFAVSGFELNNGGAVRATKTMSFVKEYISDENIQKLKSVQMQIFSDNNGEYIIRLDNTKAVDFKLPLNLNTLQVSTDNSPRYFTQVV